MPMNPKPLLIITTNTLPPQENVVRFREPAIAQTDIKTHAEQTVSCRCRRRIFEWECGNAKGDTVMIEFGMFARCVYKW